MAVMKDFSVKRQMRHANYDKRTGNEQCKVLFKPIILVKTYLDVNVLILSERTVDSCLSY